MRITFYLLIFGLMGITYGSKGGGLSQRCNAENPCDSDEFLNCDEKRRYCVCARGMRTERNFHGNELCVSAAGLSCAINPKCVKNAECLNGICECKKGFYNGPNGKCLLGYGMPCNGDYDCSEKIHRLSCIHESGKSVCGCGNNYRKGIWSKEREMCLKSLDSSCTEDAECMEKAYCSDGKCKCRRGYKEEGSQKCSKVYGQKCSEDDECNQKLLLACREGECSCQNPKTMLQWGNRCLRLAGTNENCTIGGNTGYRNDNSECVSEAVCSPWNQCMCREGRFTLKDGTCGLNPDNSFGGYCFNDLDCQPWRKLICNMEIENADYGRCKCVEGYEWTGKACGSPINGTCETYPYCGPGLSCNEGICQPPMDM